MGTPATPLVFQDPLQNPESQTYWTQAQKGQWMLKHCLACGTPHHYPRPYCPHCGSDQTEWRASSGWGEIYTFTRMVRGVETPYLMAYVRLDEGVTVLTHLQAPDWDAVHIGMRVKLAFSTSATGQNVPIFEPE
jgi:uncharacterized OB-fold protein